MSIASNVIQAAFETPNAADSTDSLLERYERAARCGGEGLWDWDLSSGAVWYSPALKALLGWPENDRSPTTFAGFQDHIPTEHRERVLRGVRQHLEQRHPLNLDFPMKTRGGTVRWFNMRGSAERDPAGHPQRLSGSLHDVTDRKNLEASLRQSQKMEAVGQLTGGIAHDFNNMLSAVIGNLQLLERPLRGHERLLKHVRTALRASLGGADLTRRLLTFARRTALEPHVVNPNTLVEGMHELLRRSLGREVEVVMGLAAEPWSVRVDPGQLENCLLNLAINARDAMPKGGTLTIETRNVTVDEALARRHPQLSAHEYLLLSVTDTGSGMSREVLKRAFEPFFTTKEVGKGTGLGLSMAYSFMEQCGGIAALSSEPNIGTTVRLYFPREHAVPAEQQAANKLTPSATDKPAPRGSEIVMVVEDDADVRATAVRALRSFGYRVLEAGSAAEALNALEAGEQIDLLFTDITLPGGFHGPALVRHAQSINPRLKVLYTTGFSESIVMRRGILDGTLPMIPKPYAITDLATRVRAALDRS